MKKDDIDINLDTLNSLTFPYTFKSYNAMYREIILIIGKKPTEEQIKELRSQTLKKHIIKLLQTYTIFDEKNIEIIQLKCKPTVELKKNDRLSYKKHFINIVARKINNEFNQGNYKFVMNTTQLLELGFLGDCYTSLRRIAKDNDSERIKEYDLNNKDGYSLYTINNKLDNHITSTITGILNNLDIPNVSIRKSPTVNYNELEQNSIYTYEAIKDETKNIMEYEQREKASNFDLSANIKVDYRTLPMQTNERYKAITNTKVNVYENWIFELNKNFEPIQKIPPDKEIENDCKILNQKFILKFRQKTGYYELEKYRNSYDYELLEREFCKLDEQADFFEPLYLYESGKLIDNSIKDYLMIKGKSNSFFDIRYLGSYIYDLNKIIEYVSI